MTLNPSHDQRRTSPSSARSGRRPPDISPAVSRRALLTSGRTDEGAARLVRAGLWHHPFRDCWWASADPPDDRQRAALALALSPPHAVLSHRSAAAWFGWVSAPGDVHLTVPSPGPGAGARHGVVVHRRQLPDEDVVTVHGARVTSHRRTCLDVLAADGEADAVRFWEERLRAPLAPPSSRR